MRAIPGTVRGRRRPHPFFDLIRALLLAAALSPLVLSCGGEGAKAGEGSANSALSSGFAPVRQTNSSEGESGPAKLWTDIPELVLAVELFNASREDQLIELEYKEDLAGALSDRKADPALAIGRYLKSKKIRDKFQSLEYLFGELYVNQSSFYPNLLALGNVNGRQLFLPVSFNMPAIVFAKGKYRPPAPLLLDLETMGSSARSFNKIEGGSYVRMGFSPRWNPDFLVLYAQAEGVDFREDKKLVWNAEGLGRTVRNLRAWSREKNTSYLAERDFEFKYLFTPDYQYIAEGRALFAYMDSSRLFTLPVEKRGALEFRWFSSKGKIPVDDDMAFAAILRSGKGKSTAETFLKWFFKEENQRKILEKAASTGCMDIAFGLAGGFSSVRSVNERAFPTYYPSMSGQMPSAEQLSMPSTLPPDWPAIKENVVAPWLLESIARNIESVDPDAEFSARMEEYRQNATITSMK